MSITVWEEKPEIKVLIQDCLAGKRVAQSALYEQYAKAMYHICLRMVASQEEAEDIMQEAFTDVFMHLQTYRHESSLGAWIKRIVVNRCINRLKSRTVQWIEWTNQEPPPEEPAGIDFDDQFLQVNKIKKAMSALPDGYRTVMTLYLFEGYDHQEIGEILHISEETSKSQYSRGRAKLRELLVNP